MPKRRTAKRKRRPGHWSLVTGPLSITVGLALLLILLLAFPSFTTTKQTYGVSFAAPHAEGIGLDWQETYDALIDDLGVKHFRLMAYWEQIEPQQGVFDFTDLDYQMDRVAEVDGQVVLAIGRKLPRWPECHVPAWARELPEAERQDAVLAMLPTVIERYKDHSALAMWQLENEPLLDFGDCPPEDRAFLAEEEVLLRSLDTAHPILVTDSGELNWWLDAAQFGDVLGTTMYRTVFSKRTKDIFSYDYWFPAWLYRAKGRAVTWLRGDPVLISELQGEPWGAAPFQEMTEAARRRSLSPARLLELQDFAARTQLPIAYWWGAEYWYWEKEVHNDPAFWEVARSFF